jgi:hypothetical protein
MIVRVIDCMLALVWLATLAVLAWQQLYSITY